ncbi:MAG TPA: c-type cytochrome, partial [Polyangiaceae bacterium]|nr:c-type cytochrome [Polyangiaceae bacterium]
SSLLLLVTGACSANGSTGYPAASEIDAGTSDAGDVTGPAPSWAELPAVVKPDIELARLPSREAQYEKLCATERGDSFYQKLCGGFRPNIRDLAGLLRFVGLDRDRAFALTGNSTSLVAMSVSAINPRIIVFPRVGGDLEKPKELIAIGFVRGEQFVEIASRDLKTGEPNFYLFSFEQECSYKGCDLAHLLTEEIEHGWTAYSVYAEQDLERTSFDCKACHQPAGFGKPKILRMQELASPWLHWFPQRFVRRTDSDRVLTTQFASTHDVDAQYGGVPVKTIVNAIDEGSGAQLEALIRAEGFGDQPNTFDPRIENEALDGGISPTWQTQYQVSLRGEAIAVPYPRADVTNEAERAAATKAYRDVVKGTAPRASLVDVRNVFSQDAMEKLNFVPQPGADGRAVLVQMCSRCHDGRADPALNRSKFNVQKLDAMPRAERDLAIARLREPETSSLRMPPWRAARMTEQATQAAITELSK